jgi:NTE family protein
MFPKRIYLSGGGICAIAHVGALMELSRHIPFELIKEWMGVSAGAFVAMCLCIGFTLEELYAFCVGFDFTNIKDIDSVPGWLLHFGIDTGDRLHKLIDACLHIKGLSSDISFKECFDKFGISLRIIATDLNDACPKIFSPIDTPHYKVSNAVRASMTVPYYFQPFRCPETGHFLVDGCVISNYPLFTIPKDEHYKTISIIIRTHLEKRENLTELEMDEFIVRPLHIILNEKMNVETHFYDSQCIQIELGNINILDFSLSDDVKNGMLTKGKESVINYFKVLQQKNKPIRRYSII